MGYTQKHADQNKATATRAKTLLDERGWDPDLEETNSFNRLVGPQLEIIKGVLQTIVAEFKPENIPLKRIQSQVHGVCSKARGRRWRERQNQ